MNVERLNAIALSILDDRKENNSVTIFNRLMQSLQSQIKQPQAPNHQQDVSKHLKSLYEALLNSAVNDFSPAWKQTLEELWIITSSQFKYCNYEGNVSLGKKE